MGMKLLILTRFPTEYEPQRLAEEANKKGIKSEVVSYGKIGLSWKKGEVKVNLPRDLNLSDFDLVIPRSSSHRNRKSLVGLKTALIRSLPETVVCLNKETFSYWPVLGKIEQGVMLAQAGIPIIPSRFLPDKAEREKFLKEARFPLICKARFGSHSKKTFRVESQKEAKAVFSQIKGEFFFQPLLESRFYWRVLVLGGKSLGIMRRQTSQKFVNQGYLGKVGKKEIEKLALAAGQVFQAELSGVDILVDQRGRPLVIEVNRCPQFKIFEKKININVAGEINSYIVNRR